MPRRNQRRRRAPQAPGGRGYVPRALPVSGPLPADPMRSALNSPKMVRLLVHVAADAFSYSFAQLNQLLSVVAFGGATVKARFQVVRIELRYATLTSRYAYLMYYPTGQSYIDGGYPTRPPRIAVSIPPHLQLITTPQSEHFGRPICLFGSVDKAEGTLNFTVRYWPDYQAMGIDALRRLFLPVQGGDSDDETDFSVTAH